MKHFLLILFILVAVSLSAFDRPVTPADSLPAYYESIDGTSGKELMDVIQRVAKQGYRADDFRYDSVWLAFKHTDLRPDSYIWEIYSDCEFIYEKDRTSNTTQTGECKGYNREHAMCQSWFGTTSLAGQEMSSSKKNSPGSDIFHIYPASYGMNSRRGNRPYGEVLTAANVSGNGTKYGTPVQTISVTNSVAGAYVEGSITLITNVLEPADEYKGDIARSYFGTMVKWAGEWTFNRNENGQVIFDATIDADTHYAPENNYGLTPYGLALLLKWHRQDPVSQKEVDRNNGIQLTQGNRNPFIDYPYLAEYIWGERSGQSLDFEQLLCSADERFLLGVSNGCIGGATQVTVDTVFWMLGDKVIDCSYIYHGSTIKYLPEEPVSCSSTSTHFMGWTPRPIQGTSTQSPDKLYNKVSEFPAIQSNTRYYAVFAEVQSTDQAGQVVSLNKSDSIDWTLTSLKPTRNSTDGDYWLLVKSASITSPQVDLSTLDSIAFTIRSYQSKKNIDILLDGVKIGQVTAATNTMQRYIWSAPELTGTNSLLFTSPDATASYGPGISEITLYLGGQQASYTHYLTHCEGGAGVDAPSVVSPYTKVLQKGQLLILRDGHTYNAQGALIQ